MILEAFLEISLGKIDTTKHPKAFADPENPTDKEVESLFSKNRDSYSGSNDGSEAIANADIKFRKV